MLFKYFVFVFLVFSHMNIPAIYFQLIYIGPLILIDHVIIFFFHVGHIKKT